MNEFVIDAMFWLTGGAVGAFFTTSIMYAQAIRDEAIAELKKESRPKANPALSQTKGDPEVEEHPGDWSTTADWVAAATKARD